MPDKGKSVKSATLSPKEVAKILKADIKTVYSGIAVGQIPAIRIGKRLFVPRVPFNRMLGKADAS